MWRDAPHTRRRRTQRRDRSPPNNRRRVTDGRRARPAGRPRRRQLAAAKVDPRAPRRERRRRRRPARAELPRERAASPRRDGACAPTSVDMCICTHFDRGARAKECLDPPLPAPPSFHRRLPHHRGPLHARRRGVSRCPDPPPSSSIDPFRVPSSRSVPLHAEGVPRPPPSSRSVPLHAEGVPRPPPPSPAVKE